MESMKFRGQWVRLCSVDILKSPKTGLAIVLGWMFNFPGTALRFHHLETLCKALVLQRVPGIESV